MTRRAAVITTIAACALAAAGPAAAATRPPASAGTPGSSAVTRLLGPGARWLRPGTRPARGRRARDGRAASAAATVFTGAELFGVSCTGRAQCTATGLVSTRSGKNARTLAERWNGTKWVVQATPTPLTSGLLGGTLAAGVSCTSSHACVAAGYSYSKKTARLLGEGWNGSKWTAQATEQAARGRPAERHLLHLGQGLHDGGTTGQRGPAGRALERQEVVRAGRQGAWACWPACPAPASRNCIAVGRTARASAGRALERQGLVHRRPPGSPMQFSSLSSVSCRTTTDCVRRRSARQREHVHPRHRSPSS